MMNQSVSRNAPRRRWLKGLVVLVLLIGLCLSGIFFYFYSQATDQLDQWLAGVNRKVNPSNIYAAPLVLQVGQRMTQAKLIDYLRLASYVEAARATEPGQGVYRESSTLVEVIPGESARLMPRERFPRLLIRFDAKRQQIQQIIEAESNRPLQTCRIEPVVISTVTRSLGGTSWKNERGVRYEVHYRQLPPHLVKAVLAIEDRSFFDHAGVSLMAIARALWRNYRQGRTVEGGSTITQQLVKNILVGAERTYQRKLQEAFLALALERRLTKEQIFTQYANTIYMGYRGGLSIYGFGAAAREYFNKDVSKLSLPEAALLAGMIHRPAYYLMEEHRDEALKRRNIVLDAMVQQQAISPEQAEEAKRSPIGLTLKTRPGEVEANTPYFLDYVQEQLAREMPNLDLAEAGYRVYTTLDMGLQMAASVAVGEGLAVLERDLRIRRSMERDDSLQAALVVLDARSGDILAMVGGRSYAQSQLNRVTDAQRQPGSAIKPFVYAAALSSGMHEENPITLATMYMDSKRSFEDGYTPENFGGKYLDRMVSVREALARSLNVVTVALAQDTGYSVVANMIQRCGLPRPESSGATALGAAEVTPLELASAYTAFVAGGRRVAPTALRYLASSDGSLVRSISAQKQSVMSPQVAYIVLSALRDVIRQPYGTAHEAAALGDFALAGKTGTSQRSDAWFVGLTPATVCVVWVGFDNNSPLFKTGSSAALPIWISFMRQAARLRPDLLAGDFVQPEGLIERLVDPDTGMLATTRCPKNRIEFFLEGRELAVYCSVHPGPALELPEITPPETEQPASVPFRSMTSVQEGHSRDDAEQMISDLNGEKPQTRPRRINQQTRISLRRPSPVESPQ